MSWVWSCSASFLEQQSVKCVNVGSQFKNFWSHWVKLWWLLHDGLFGMWKYHSIFIWPLIFILLFRLSPIGVFFLIAAKILEMESLAEVIGKLGKYFITVMFGLFIHGLGTIAIIFYIVVRKLPYGYILKMSQVLATAFGTGSSSATMPITINCLDNMGIDPRVTRFVVPVGATINMWVARLFVPTLNLYSYFLK